MKMQFLQNLEEFIAEKKQAAINEDDLVPGTKVKIKETGETGEIDSWSDETNKYIIIVGDTSNEYGDDEIEIIESEQITESDKKPGTEIKIKGEDIKGTVLSWSDDTKKYIVELENGDTRELGDDEIE